MFRDLCTVMWLEIKVLTVMSKPKKVFLKVGPLLFILGIFLPLSFRIDWLNSVTTIYYWSWFGCYFVIGTFATSILRERKQNSLDTLLASPLSDTSILYGKFIASFIYIFSYVFYCIILGLITINIFKWQGHILFYSFKIGIGGIIFSILSMCTVAGLTFLLTMRAKEMLKSIQIISIITLLLIIPGYYFYYLNMHNYPQLEYIRKINIIITNRLLLLLIVIQLTMSIVILYLIKIKFNRKYLSGTDYNY